MNPVVQDIVNQLQPYHPEKIILFGSYAYGKPTQDSDIDLVLIKKTDQPFHERQKQVRSLLKTTTAVDVFIFTPEEYKQNQQTNLFIKEIANSGKIIYG